MGRLKKLLILTYSIFTFVSLTGCNMSTNSANTSPTATSTQLSSAKPTQVTAARISLGITLNQFINRFNKDSTLFTHNGFVFTQQEDQNVAQYKNKLLNGSVCIYVCCYKDEMLVSAGVGITKNELAQALSKSGVDTSGAMQMYFHYFTYSIFQSYSETKCDQILSELFNSTPTVSNDTYTYYKQVGDINLKLIFYPSLNTYYLTAAKNYVSVANTNSSSNNNQTEIASSKTNLEEWVLEGKSRYYTHDELKKASKYELSILRNGMYALSGKKFTTNTEVKDFFENQTSGWYSPNTTDEDVAKSRMNDYQYQNLQLIIKAEKELGYR